MMKQHRIIAAGLALALLSGCAGNVEPLTPDSGSPNIEAAASEQADRALAAFGGQLLAESRKEGENTLVSPLSVLLCLSMCANGAEGETLQEFLDTLSGGVELDTLNANCASLIEDYQALEGSTKCVLADSLWVDDELNVEGDFLQRCVNGYKASVYQTDLSAPETKDRVNGWVDEQTQGMIDRILEEDLESDTMLLLMNALYLKNAWENEFSADDTRPQNFYPASGEPQSVDFLRSEGCSQKYISTEAERGVILPYDDGRLAFLAVMPAEGDLSGYLSNWDGEKLPALLGEATEASLYLALPKFEAEWEASLVEVLQRMGIETAFIEGAAQFDPMGTTSNGAGLYLFDVLHKTRIAVNEKGTEAAAVTVGIMNAESAPMFDEELVFDHPFVYGIVDLERGVPLFLGTFETP